MNQTTASTKEAYATNNGSIDAEDLFWGGRTLARVIAELSE